MLVLHIPPSRASHWCPALRRRWHDAWILLWGRMPAASAQAAGGRTVRIMVVWLTCTLT